MDDRLPLRLDTTGQLIGGPLVPPRQDGGVDRIWLAGSVAQLLLVGR